MLLHLAQPLYNSVLVSLTHKRLDSWGREKQREGLKRERLQLKEQSQLDQERLFRREERTARLRSIAHLAISTPPVAPKTRLMSPDEYSQQCSKAQSSNEGLTIDSELSSSQGSNHDKTCSETSEAPSQTELLGNLDQTTSDTLTWQTLGLVDFAEHGVGWL